MFGWRKKTKTTEYGDALIRLLNSYSNVLSDNKAIKSRMDRMQLQIKELKAMLVFESEPVSKDTRFFPVNVTDPDPDTREYGMGDKKK